MLSILPRTSAEERSPIWFDLLSPTEAEMADVEKRTGQTLPRRNNLSEIERSSRLQHRNGALTMSTPTMLRGPVDGAVLPPLGFVLSAELRQATCIRRRAGAAGAERTINAGGLEVFTQLCEEIVDRAADGLEQWGEELGGLSIAASQEKDENTAQAVEANRILSAQLRKVCRLGNCLSEVGDADPATVRRAFLERDGSISVMSYAGEPAILETKVEDGVRTIRIPLDPHRWQEPMPRPSVVPATRGEVI